MITLKEICQEIKVFKNMEADEVADTIIEAFFDYEFEGDDYVELGSPNTNIGISIAENVVNSAGIAHDNADIRFTLVENPDGTWNVEDAWVNTI